MRILALTNPNSGVGFHRLSMPLIYMVKNRPDDYILITNNFSREVLDRCFDIVILNRCPDISSESMAYLRQEYGFKLVVDNDDYWQLDVHHVLYDHYTKHGIGQRITEFLKIADLCTCTHERLAEKIREYNKNVHVIPNALPYGDGQFSDARTQSDKVRFYWAGSDTHAKDVSLLRGPIKRVYSDGELRSKIKMVMSGYTEKSKPVWDVMLSSFTCGGQLDATVYQYAEVEKYMYAAADSDVHMIPLLESPFTSMKSNLKVLEAAAKKCPAIVSYCNPYLDLPVCYAPTQTRWYQWMKELAGSESLRKEKGEQLFDFCNERFNLSKWNEVRLQLYKTLL